MFARCHLGIDRRHLPALQIVHEREVRSTQFVSRFADKIDEVARLLEIHRHAPRHIIDLPHRADQQRRRNRDRLSLCRARRCS